MQEKSKFMLHSLLTGTQAWNFVFEFFCRNQNLMVPRACNPRFLKIVLNSAEIFDIRHFRVCSGSNEICSTYAQCAMKLVLRMHSMDLHVKTVHILPLAEQAQKFVPRMLSVWWNCFLVCSVCDKIVSEYAQHAYAIIFKNYFKIPN